MKEGLLLTLKELIRLGIIKTKRKKKRAPYGSSRQMSTMQSMDKALNPQSKRTGSVVTTSTPETSSQRNTDALRLRDEQALQNVKLIEYKKQLEDEKALFENRTKAITDDIARKEIMLQRELQRLQNRMNRNADWENDNTDIASTFGSDNFQAQTSMTPATERNVSFSQSAMQQSDNVSDITNPLPQITNKKSRGRPRSNISLNTRRKIATQLKKEERIRQQQEKTSAEYEQFLKDQEAEQQYKFQTPYVPIDPDNPPIAFTTKIQNEPFTNEGEVELLSVASEPKKKTMSRRKPRKLEDEED